MSDFCVPVADFECSTDTDNHCIAYLKSPKTAICFAMCLEIPIPWECILYHHEKVFLQPLLCSSVELEMCSVFNKFLQPDFTSLTSRWCVHCHCSDQHSLQCLAGRRVVVGLVEAVLKGTMYNQMFWNYRAYVNRNMPETLMYVGSVFIRRIHFVFIRVILDKDMNKIRTQNFGESFYINGLYSNFLILVCRSCNLSECQAQICARRTRRYMKRALLCCSGPKVPSKKEPFRQRELLRFLKYGEHFTYKYVKYL